MSKNLKRLIVIAMMLSLAIVVNYLESFIPFFIPGVRLGLANVIILIMLYEFKYYEALTVDVLRILIVALIRGTLFQPIFFMSLAGGILSYIGMLIISKIKIFTAVSASAVGALLHAFGQILVAIIIVDSVNIMLYLPFIGSLSLLTGILSGIFADNYLIRSITSNYILVNDSYKLRNKKEENIEI